MLNIHNSRELSRRGASSFRGPGHPVGGCAGGRDQRDEPAAPGAHRQQGHPRLGRHRVLQLLDAPGAAAQRVPAGDDEGSRCCARRISRSRTRTTTNTGTSALPRHRTRPARIGVSRSRRCSTCSGTIRWATRVPPTPRRPRWSPRCGRSCTRSTTRARADRWRRSSPPVRRRRWPADLDVRKLEFLLLLSALHHRLDRMTPSGRRSRPRCGWSRRTTNLSAGHRWTTCLWFPSPRWAIVLGFQYLVDGMRRTPIGTT